jgi:hypothetical protein
LKDQETINKQILIAERELATLDAKRAALQDRIRQLKRLKQSIADEQLPFDRLSESTVTNDSTQEQKIDFFRSMFRGREDIYSRRFESKRSGKSGYHPVYRKEWIRPFCQKPKIKCGDCENRDFISLSDDVVRNHLIGFDPADRYRREFVIGGMGKKQRHIALNALESLPDHAEKALLATGRYLGEGFDDERLDTLFLTLPISWRGTISHHAGRLHRIHDSKKEVVIYDCVDLDVPVLARMYDKRIKGYRSIGYEIGDDQS